MFNFARPFTQPVSVMGLAELFDADWYRARYPETAASGTDPLTHFCRNGWREGRTPNFYFDTSWYCAKYEVAEDANPLVHYLERGEREGAWPSPRFDPEWYRSNYGLAEDECALRHYLLRCTSGAVSPRPDFDVEAYCLAHPEVLERGLDPYRHYLGRDPPPPEASPTDPRGAVAMASIPTYAMVEEALGLEAGTEPPPTVPWTSLIEVIRLFLSHIPVDETWYCSAYPDVAEAIRAGWVSSAAEHFIAAGYFEGRAPREASSGAERDPST